ncbi:hypothetical protein D9757_009772 [Collybiopsis confluens]|uniref:Ubiquitin-like protease family profile domain-containing protein n=1 Tax=Collybiopsis confluens TaxID=2823264 RepID=A0A8H5GY26_9AGAR|nr:hypothetical protein D9757_009772 [Collybiopsis confluens]
MSIATRAIYHNLPSSPRLVKLHKKCPSVNCPPFGPIRSCTLPFFRQINDLINSCNKFIPSISLQQLLTLVTIDELDALVASAFPKPSAGRFYLDTTLQIVQLREASRVISTLTTVQSRLAQQIKYHRALPSDDIVLVVLCNLKTLYGCIGRKQGIIESSLWEKLDEDPEQAEVKLRALVNESSHNPSLFNQKFQFVRLSDFRTLGAGRWVNDEVVNYFVEKWCTESGSTLGLNSFFAPKCLFNPGTSIPKNGFLSEVDEFTVEKWCRKTAKKQKLDYWDSVFIPINENGTHWYSARIDFRQKRIDIYDSLKERCVSNRVKPPLLRKNAGLMLILLWLTEILSRLRGEEVNLKNNKGSGWTFDPHFEVYFQPNNYDCGIHLLWHLRHILEFRQIQLGDKCRPNHLKFTDNMVGKRLRLAQEMLLDVGLV